MPALTPSDIEQLKLKGDIQGLVQLLDPEVFLPFRRMAASALGSIGSTQAVEPLLAILKDKDIYLRQQAVIALGRIGDRRALEPLLDLLGDKDRSVWLSLPDALDQIQKNWPVMAATRQRLPLLIAMLQNTDSTVRWKAMKILTEISDRRALEPLLDLLGDQNDERWYDVYDALLRLQKNWPELAETKQRLPLLITDLQNADRVTRRSAAARVLGQTGDERAIEPLIAALEDKSGMLSWTIVVALGEIGDARAISPLVNHAKNVQEQTKDAITSLEKVLGRVANRVSSEELYLVAGLENLTAWVHDAENDLYREDIWEEPPLKSVSLNCSSVRQLAQQELSRRGLPL